MSLGGRLAHEHRLGDLAVAEAVSKELEGFKRPPTAEELVVAMAEEERKAGELPGEEEAGVELDEEEEPTEPKAGPGGTFP